MTASHFQGLTQRPILDASQRRHPPTLIRLLWLAASAAVIYLSLYPLTDWRLRQPGPFAFLSQGIPLYYSQADLVSNVAAYVIFGLLFALGWSTRTRAWLPAAMAALASMLLSLSLESLQSYLPARVPSLLDLSANTAGGVIGGVIGAVVGRYRIPLRDGPTPASRQWYEQGPALGWALVVMWVISQLPTQRLLFSTGHLQAWLPQTLSRPGGVLPGLQLDALLPESLRSVHETLVVATMICILGVLVMDLVRSAAWRTSWMAGLMALAVALRVLSSPPFESSQRLLVWLTSGAQAGLLVGALTLYLVGAFERRTRLRVGVALVLMGLFLVNIAPVDPFFQSTQAAAHGVLAPGMTPSLRSLINGIGAFWPLMALAYLLARLVAMRRRPPDKLAAI